MDNKQHRNQEDLDFQDDRVDQDHQDCQDVLEIQVALGFQVVRVHVQLTDKALLLHLQQYFLCQPGTCHGVAHGGIVEVQVELPEIRRALTSSR